MEPGACRPTGNGRLRLAVARRRGRPADLSAPDNGGDRVAWVMALPPELAMQFNTEVARIEEAKRMPYLMELERSALELGRQEGHLQGVCEMLLRQLERQFGPLADGQRAIVKGLTETEAVDMGLALLAAKSLAELGL